MTDKQNIRTVGSRGPSTRVKLLQTAGKQTPVFVRLPSSRLP
ncbi:hypothetical protein [Paenibacillus koleovorans]|nr:hypothetical protein [Paenibacillus koleovorans]